MFKKKVLKELACTAGGFLIGTAGIAILASKDAKKLYTHVTAAALRGKDKIMETGAKIKANAGDVYEDASVINNERTKLKNKEEFEKAKAVVAAYGANE